MSILDQRSHIEVQLKGYPHGRKVKCHIWTEKDWSKKYLTNFVKENLKLEGELEGFIIHDILVRNTVYTNQRHKKNEDYDTIITDSITYITMRKKENKKKDDSKKEEKTNLKKVTIYNQTDDDIKWMIQTLNDELFMREHELSNDHFDFLSKNEEVTLENVKELFEKCGGDIFKLRKSKIRENIKNLLN